MTRPILNPAVALAAHLVGGQTALARRLGPSVRQGHVWDWIYTTGKPPPIQCVAIEIATSREVRCEQICPDLSWERNDQGQVTAYRVPLNVPAVEPAGLK